MIKNRYLIISVITLFLFPTMILSQETLTLEIFPEEAELQVGDSLQFNVSFMDTNGVAQDTTATWSFSPDSLAILSPTGMLYALACGEGLLTATLDTLLASAEISIDPQNEDPPGGENQHLTILPGDSLLHVGATVQFYASVGDSMLADSIITWSLAGMPIGIISETGALVVTAPGFALVEASAGEYSGATYVIAADTTIDTSGVNSITITRDSPNPQGYSVMSELEEGDAWTMAGLPHPMNVLNGGKVFFPVGSISQNIRIHVALPDFFQAQGDSVHFGFAGVVGGVQFRVMTDDTTVVEPFYFDTPLLTALVYKRGLLDHLGIDPEMLSLYFTTTGDDTIYFDDTGIGNTTVDPYSNRIYASVAHFSDLTVAADLNSTTRIDEGNAQKPDRCILHQNFPNPFNPATMIRYDLPAAEVVSMSIYDINGRMIMQYPPSYQQAGRYQVKWSGLSDQGLPVSTGVYFCRIQVGTETSAIKMMLIK